MVRLKLHISSLPMTLNLSQYQIGVTKNLHLSNPKLKGLSLIPRYMPHTQQYCSWQGVDQRTLKEHI